MPYLLPLSVVHLAALAWLSRATARRLFAAPLPALFTGVILAWVNLVLTALVASPFRLLGSPPVYFGISLALAVATHRFFRWACPETAAVDGPSARELVRELGGGGFPIVLGGLLLVVVGCVLWIALTILPNNWDTLAYRFPKAIFYLSSGGLVHAAEYLDPRLLYYPYDGTLLYLFLAQYQWPPISWNLIGVGAWLLVGLASFELVLLMRGSVRAAVVSVYLVLTTPIVLCLANSTNDELLAAAPLAIAVVFALRWSRRGSPQALYLALLAGSLALAVKLHWVALVPYFGAGVLVVLARRGRELARVARATLRPAALAAVFTCAALLAGSFLFTNYLATLEWRVVETDYAAEIVNRPFHLGAAVQTAGLYAVQMLLSPLPDHVRALGVERGRAAYRWANEQTLRWLGPHVRQGPPYTHDLYRFRGLVEPGAEGFFEQTLWLGFVPHLCLAALAALAWRPELRGTLPVFLLAALPAWHLTHSALVRYAETTGTYFAYAAPLFAAPLGWLWQRSRQSRRWSARSLAAALVLLVASNTWLAGTLLATNWKRNLRLALAPGDGETTVTRTTPQLRQVVAAARVVAVPYTHWELLYWNLMRLNPAARFHVERTPAEVDLTLYSLARRLDENFALRVLPARAGAHGTVRLAGEMGTDADVVFCSGPTCERACAGCERYVLLPFGRDGTVETGRWFVGGRPPRSLAALPGGAVRLTFSLRGAPREVASPWMVAGELAVAPRSFATGELTGLSVEISSLPGGEGDIARTELRFDGDRLAFD